VSDNDDEPQQTDNVPRILIADDHPVMLDALARLVRTEYEIVGTVADGDLLVSEARRLRPDIVISDLFMPTLDGFAAGRQIKRELPATRLIYVTAHADPAFVAEALQIGAFAVLPKISAARELLAVIRRAIAAGVTARGEIDVPGPA
jgi:DNA-binding NarL/FixJ family response regulator